MFGHEGHAAIQHLDLLGFLALGVLGGVAHCVGMCSPFVLIVSRQGTVLRSRPSVITRQLWYTAGRITTYATLGACAGALGHVVDLGGALVGIQRAAAAIAGIALVLWAIAALWHRDIVAPGCGGWFSRLAAPLKDRVRMHPLTMGLFLGLLPCGLVYSVLIAAVARGSAAQGALALVVFGAGTAPALLGVSLADSLLARPRPLLTRLSNVFVLAMGAWFLWRGLAV
jgi:uncharacterized protein